VGISNQYIATECVSNSKSIVNININMKELDIEFKGIGEVSDFWFKQIHASEHAYVYEIRDVYDNRHYEVFRRKERQESETVIQGIKLSRIAKVIYPKSNSFGVWAWCYRDSLSAMMCCEKLNIEGYKND
jgi:hypothetical protein